MTELTDNQLITELKQRLDNHRSAQEQLTQLNNELLEVNKKLTDSESLKSHFLSNISNEIMNPFTAIVGLAQTISQLEHCDLPKIKKMAELILTEAFHMDFQLKNIFMAASLETGEFCPQLKTTNINLLVENLLGIYAGELHSKDISLIFTKLNPEMLFVTDPEKAELIISNLLNNAILFSHTGGKVELRMSLDEVLEIQITDYGIGIRESDFSNIFNRFTRIENNINSINRGNGLGLSISRALAEVLGGKIDLTSNLGLGSTFRLTLPISEVIDNETHFASESGNETFF
jgi:signal transduction histidine kinase